MAKIKGLGTTLSVGGSTVGQVRSISKLFSGEVSTIDATDLDSTVREHVSGIGDMGSLDFELVYDPAVNSSAFVTLLEEPADDTAIVITLSNNGTIGFDGILTSFEVTGAEIDGLLVASGSFKINGEVTVTPPGS